MNYLSLSITLGSDSMKGIAFEDVDATDKVDILAIPTSNNKIWIHIENVSPFYQKIYCAE
jgi:hypothetical protein